MAPMANPAAARTPIEIPATCPLSSELPLPLPPAAAGTSVLVLVSAADVEVFESVVKVVGRAVAWVSEENIEVKDEEKVDDDDDDDKRNEEEDEVEGE